MDDSSSSGTDPELPSTALEHESMGTFREIIQAIVSLPLSEAIERIGAVTAVQTKELTGQIDDLSDLVERLQGALTIVQRDAAREDSVAALSGRLGQIDDRIAAVLERLNDHEALTAQLVTSVEALQRSVMASDDQMHLFAQQFDASDQQLSAKIEVVRSMVSSGNHQNDAIARRLSEQADQSRTRWLWSITMSAICLVVLVLVLVGLTVLR